MLRILALTLAILSLNGCVATALVGGGAAVANAAGDERPVGQHFDDVDLATRIEARLIAEKDMPSRWINVEVIAGEVTQIMLGEPKLSNMISDSWITAQVKAKLVRDPIVTGLSIHVETVDGRVYLMGIIKQNAQRQRAVMLTRSVDGVTDVVDLLRAD